MRQEEANLMYGENSWGVYRFKVNDKNVLHELLNFNERHPTDTMLNVYANGARLSKSNYLFDMNEAAVYLYYRERAVDVAECICSNMTLQKAWTDSDCYDLSVESKGQMAKETVTSRRILLQMMKLNDDFLNLFIPKYNKEE